jgi:hypothetical protein
LGTKTILYVGPFAAGVEIETGQWLDHGDPVEVDEDVVGRSPSGTPGEDDYDAGAGLLAQTANFVEADLSASTVAKVLESVGDDPARAEAALAAEQAKGDKARKSLIDKLEALVAGGKEDESNAG